MLYSILLWIAFMAGLMVCVTIDRVTRASYRQERILEAQREVIDRLQRAELQRQVAARSRVLSEALTRFCDAPRTPMPLAPGDIIDERYRIVRAVGKGGMGQVHEVERLTDGRRLALKTLTGVAHREALAGFAREAQVAAELQHPNVVATLDIGVTRSGMLFFVMELVAGASLAAERSRHALLGGLRRAGSARRKGACARLRAARRTIRSGDRKVPIRSLTGRMSIDSVSSLS